MPDLLAVAATLILAITLAALQVLPVAAQVPGGPQGSGGAGPDSGAGGPAQAAPQAPGFTGNLPRTGGLGLGVWQGGRPEDVPGFAAQLGCRVQSLWVIRNGQFAGLVYGAPEAVNAPFRVSLTGGSLPPGPVLLACGQDAEAIPAVQSAADATLDALRTRDQLRLRDMTSDQLRTRLRDQDLQQLASCVPAGAQLHVQSREVAMNGDQAQVRLRLQVTPPSGAAYGLERTWEFQWQPDSRQWRLSAPPACPFASDQTSLAPVQATADAVLAALRDRDQTRLRDMTGDELRTRLRDQDMQQLATCVPAGAQLQVQSREVVVNADQAQVRLRIQITPPNGAAYSIERMWEFQQQTAGQWRLSATPACPWAPPA